MKATREIIDRIKIDCAFGELYLAHDILMHSGYGYIEAKWTAMGWMVTGTKVEKETTHQITFPFNIKQFDTP